MGLRSATAPKLFMDQPLAVMRSLRSQDCAGWAVATLDRTSFCTIPFPKIRQDPRPEGRR